MGWCLVIPKKNVYLRVQRTVTPVRIVTHAHGVSRDTTSCTDNVITSAQRSLSPTIILWSASPQCTVKWATGVNGAPVRGQGKPVASNGAKRREHERSYKTPLRRGLRAPWFLKGGNALSREKDVSQEKVHGGERRKNAYRRRRTRRVVARGRESESRSRGTVRTRITEIKQSIDAGGTRAVKLDLYREMLLLISPLPFFSLLVHVNPPS